MPIEERLARLEARMRLQRWLAAPMVVAIATALYLGRADDAEAAISRVVKHLTVQSLRVEDDAGEVRALLFVNERGATVLSLYDSAGEIGSRLEVGAEGAPEFTLRREGSRAVVSVGPGGAPAFVVLDRDRNPRASLGGLPSGSFGIALHDALGNETWRAPR